MGTEVLNGPVSLGGPAGATDASSGKCLLLKEHENHSQHSHMGNGILENGILENGHHDETHEDSSVNEEPGKAESAENLANGCQPTDVDVGNDNADMITEEQPNAEGNSVTLDPFPGESAPAASSAVASGAEESVEKGILGTAPPIPQGNIPNFGEVPLGALQQPAAAEKVVKRYDFYLVKVPRPDLTVETNRMKTVQLIISEKKEKQSFINAALRLKQAARSEVQAALRGARDRVRECSAEVRRKIEEVKPLQDMLRRLNDGRKGALAQGRGLEATSEAELNQLIVQKENRRLHESISLSEEKQLLKEIKMLEASRPKVREIEALNVSVAESLGTRDAIQAQLKPLLADVDFLKEARDAAQEILKTFEAEVHESEEPVRQLMLERGQVTHEQDVLYDELRALRAEAYKKEDDFRQFRRDMAAAMQLADNKDIEGLEKFCHDQRERMHQKLNTDVAYRKAYVAANQWSTIRRFGTLDTRRLGVDEDVATVLGHNPGDAAKGMGAGRGAGPGQQARQQAEEKGGKAESGAGERKSAGSKKAEDSVPAAKATPAGAGGKGKDVKKASAVAPAPGEDSGKAEADRGGGKAPAATPEQVAAAAEAAEAEKEARRQEALSKAKEAEDRKRKQAERAKQRAEAKAAKDAEEAAKRREKEKERKARKKAALEAEKASAAAAASEAEEAAAAEGGEGAADSAVNGSSPSKGAHAAEHLTKRQRKRLAAGKGRGAEAEGDAAKGSKGKGAGAYPGVLLGVGVGVAVLVAIILVLFLFKEELFAGAGKPVFAE